ncbi:hypothetical protein CRE_08218 [Caenorhabditis remanei]|uniref:Uncharacterized protein n=1 Tax=Caenorhabditis remanei TaxID=31234 RepID=E3M339_CAERE|nr:hypothetical protein CRE_08218 [Caenorhabditis remanei]
METAGSRTVIKGLAEGEGVFTTPIWKQPNREESSGDSIRTSAKKSESDDVTVLSGKRQDHQETKNTSSALNRGYIRDVVSNSAKTGKDREMEMNPEDGNLDITILSSSATSKPSEGDTAAHAHSTETPSLKSGLSRLFWRKTSVSKIGYAFIWNFMYGFDKSISRPQYMKDINKEGIRNLLKQRKDLGPQLLWKVKETMHLSMKVQIENMLSGNCQSDQKETDTSHG